MSKENEEFEFNPNTYTPCEIKLIRHRVKKASDVIKDRTNTRKNCRPENNLGRSTYIWALCVCLGSRVKASLALGKSGENGNETRYIRFHLQKIIDSGISPFPSDMSFTMRKRFKSCGIFEKLCAHSVAQEYETKLYRTAGERAESNSKKALLTRIRLDLEEFEGKGTYQYSDYATEFKRLTPAIKNK